MMPRPGPCYCRLNPPRNTLSRVAFVRCRCVHAAPPANSVRSSTASAPGDLGGCTARVPDSCCSSEPRRGDARDGRRASQGRA
eukprot:1211833-Rhodomonas_salina.2